MLPKGEVAEGSTLRWVQGFGMQWVRDNDMVDFVNTNDDTQMAATDVEDCEPVLEERPLVGTNILTSSAPMELGSEFHDHGNPGLVTYKQMEQFQ